MKPFRKPRYFLVGGNGEVVEQHHSKTLSIPEIIEAIKQLPDDECMTYARMFSKIDPHSDKGISLNGPKDYIIKVLDLLTSTPSAYNHLEGGSIKSFEIAEETLKKNAYDDAIANEYVIFKRAYGDVDIPKEETLKKEFENKYHLEKVIDYIVNNELVMSGKQKNWDFNYKINQEIYDALYDHVTDYVKDHIEDLRKEFLTMLDEEFDASAELTDADKDKQHKFLDKFPFYRDAYHAEFGKYKIISDKRGVEYLKKLLSNKNIEKLHGEKKDESGNIIKKSISELLDVEMDKHKIFYNSLPDNLKFKEKIKEVTSILALHKFPKVNMVILPDNITDSIIKEYNEAATQRTELHRNAYNKDWNSGLNKSVIYEAIFEKKILKDDKAADCVFYKVCSRDTNSEVIDHVKKDGDAEGKRSDNDITDSPKDISGTGFKVNKIVSMRHNFRKNGGNRTRFEFCYWAFTEQLQTTNKRNVYYDFKHFGWTPIPYELFDLTDAEVKDTFNNRYELLDWFNKNKVMGKSLMKLGKGASNEDDSLAFNTEHPLWRIYSIKDLDDRSQLYKKTNLDLKKNYIRDPSDPENWIPKAVPKILIPKAVPEKKFDGTITDPKVLYNQMPDNLKSSNSKSINLFLKSKTFKDNIKLFSYNILHDLAVKAGRFTINEYLKDNQQYLENLKPKPKSKDIEL